MGGGTQSTTRLVAATSGTATSDTSDRRNHHRPICAISPQSGPSALRRLFSRRQSIDKAEPIVQAA